MKVGRGYGIIWGMKSLLVIFVLVGMVAEGFAADFVVSDFGAKGDGEMNCRGSFGAAMEACAKAGGGRVVVPKGKWRTGAIQFRSNCELHLEEGAEIVFSQEVKDYLPEVATSWEGMECWNYSPLVYAYGCTNVAITGSGVIRGFEGAWEDSAWYKWVPDENGIKEARRQLYIWGAEDFPVEARQIWKMKNANTRPHLIQFNRCKGVRLEGFKVRNAPFWTIHLYMCVGAVVKGLDVFAHGANNDGIDIEMTKDVLVEGCRFDQGDDGVVIKSGRNRDAWRLGTATENVVVRDCEIVNAHTVLGIGSEISGGVKNVRMEKCRAGDVIIGVYVKTNRRRGGVIEGICVDGLEVKNVERALVGLATDVLYQWAEFPDYENRTTVIRDIEIRNVRGKKAARRLSLVGDEKMPVKDFRIQNVTVESAAEGDIVKNVELIEKK